MNDPHDILDTAHRIVEALGKMSLAHVHMKSELNYEELRKAIALVAKENDNLRGRIDIASRAFTGLKREVNGLILEIKELKERDND